MKKRGALFIMAILSSSLIFSQPYKGKARLSGYVYDMEGNPLEGVRVKLFSRMAQSGLEVMTDAKGKWTTAWIRSGAWDIRYEHIGYMPQEISTTLKLSDERKVIEAKLAKVEGLVITPELNAALAEGNKFFEEEKYEEALATYIKILEDNPEVYIIFRNIGNCYFKMEKYDKAIEYFFKVFEKYPYDNSIILDIGNCYANSGDNGKAFEWYSKIKFEEIDNPIVLYNIGTSFYNLSMFQDALKFYKKASEIQDDFLDAIFQLGLTYLALGNNLDSLSTFKNYLKNDSDSGRASQVKGFIEFIEKKEENLTPAGL